MINLVYRLQPGEGPEPKAIGGGFDLRLIPGEVFPVADRARARHMVDKIGSLQYATPADQRLAEMTEEEFSATTQADQAEVKAKKSKKAGGEV